MHTQKQKYKIQNKETILQSTMNTQSLNTQGSKQINSFIINVQRQKQVKFQNNQEKNNQMLKAISQIQNRNIPDAPQPRSKLEQQKTKINPKNQKELNNCIHQDQFKHTQINSVRQKKTNIAFRTFAEKKPQVEKNVQINKSFNYGAQQINNQNNFQGSMIPSSLESYNDFINREYVIKITEIDQNLSSKKGEKKDITEQKDKFMKKESILFNLSKSQKQKQKQILDKSQKQKIDRFTENRKTFQSFFQDQSSQIQVYQLQKQAEEIFKNHSTQKLNINNKKQDTSQNKCYLEIFQNKWEKVQLKINKNRVNVGPITIELHKILKIKIFPSDICEQSKADYQKLKKYQRIQKNDKIKEKSERDSKLYKSVDIGIQRTIDMYQYAEDNSIEDQNGRQSEMTEILKKNLIKITTENENVFQYYQKYPVVFPFQPKQLYSSLNNHQPQTPKISLNSSFPAPYLSFSRLILKKLKQLYPKIKSTQWTPPQFPIRTVIQSNGPQFSPPSSTKKWNFNKLNTKNYAYIHGKIYKKSQVKGKWQKRYVIINQNGIYSYKNQKDDFYSFIIQYKNIKYMWTWFTVLKVDKIKDQQKSTQLSDKQENSFAKRLVSELKKNMPSKQNKEKLQKESENASIQKTRSINKWENQVRRQEENDQDSKNSYLIIKLKHGFNGQTEFGIPICGFDNQDNKNKNWLYAFYRILSQYQY